MEGLEGFGAHVIDAEKSLSVWTRAVSSVEASLKGDDSTLRESISRVSKMGLKPLLESWLFQLIETERIDPEAFKLALERSDLQEALRVAVGSFRPLWNLCLSLENRENEARSDNGLKRLRTTFDNALLLGNADMLHSFRTLVRKFLQRHFRENHNKFKSGKTIQRNNMDSDSDDEELESEEEQDEEDSDQALGFEEFAEAISTLDWFSFFEEPVSEILCLETEKYILRVCKGRFESELLGRVCEWLNSVCLEWLRKILAACITGWHSEMHQKEKFEQWKARLEFHVFETLCELRMSEIFDIIAEFPDSAPSLVDLKDCLSRTHQYRELVQSLRYAFASRLLHPGANTAQILDVYISTIKSLRLLDPSGVLFEAISEPIKSYLRKREDTVRCIVTSLTDDSNSELFEELGKSGEIQPLADDINESDDEGELDDAAEAAAAQDWTPDPIEADPRKTSRSRKSSDILSMLVHIYGSKELFVNEYRLLLADKLLSSLDFDTDREVRNLELLKLRFGENSMLNCEIMIKDIQESKRINTNIKTTLQNNKAKQAKRPSETNLELETMEVTIVSKQFWPTLHGEDIKVHPIVKDRMEAMAQEYSVLKNPRQLVWKSNLGLVQLELEFDAGQTKSFTVNPLLASLIMYFGEKEKWTAAELGTAVELDEDTLKKRMSYWVNQGVVRAKSEPGLGLCYHAVDNLSEDHEIVDEEATETAVSADAQLAEEMKVYGDFVRGMLNNYESLPLERIHNMLKMFVSTGEHKYDKNIQQLQSFMDKLVQDDVLDFVNGNYFIKKT